MKKFRIIGLIVVALVAVTACKKLEKILPKKDGLWNVTSANIKSYVDDSLTSDQTETDSLGTIFFDKDDVGHMTDANGDVTNFTWTVNDDNDKVTIITSTDTTVSDVLESSKDEQVWFSTSSFVLLGTTYRFDATSTMNRAD